MIMRPVVALLLASTAYADPSTAYADPATEIRSNAESTELPDGDSADTFPHLDAHLRISVDRLAMKIQRLEQRWQLGRARLALETQWRDSNRDVAVRGWHTALSGSYDLGGLRLTTTVGLEHVDTDLGRDSLLTTGIAIGKGFQLSRGVRAWIGLSLGHRQWLGRPPLGEANATQIMLSARLTY